MPGAVLPAAGGLGGERVRGPGNGRRGRAAFGAEAGFRGEAALGAVAGRGQRERRRDLEPAARQRSGTERAAAEVHPLAHADDPVPGSRGRHAGLREYRGQAAVVGYPDDQVRVRVADADDTRGARTRVLDHVRERLLDDPVRRQVHARGRGPGVPGDLQGDLDPGTASAPDEPVQARQPRRGGERRLPGLAAAGDRLTAARWRLASSGIDPRRTRRHVLLAEHAEHPAHLLKGVPACRLDRAERVLGAVGPHVDDVLAVAGLDGDHGHAVRHDVVQFARDPQPFLGDRAARRLLLQRHHVQPALPHRVPGHPGDDVGERDRDELARRRGTRPQRP